MQNDLEMYFLNRLDSLFLMMQNSVGHMKNTIRKLKEVILFLEMQIILMNTIFTIILLDILVQEK